MGHRLSLFSSIIVSTLIISGCFSSSPPPPAPPESTQQPMPVVSEYERARAEAERRAAREREEYQQREAERRSLMQSMMEEERRLELEERKKQAAQQANTPQFPWPPAKPSSFTKVPFGLLGVSDTNKTSLKDLDSKIRQALERGGYYDASYYTIPGQPNAYALVTRLERFNLEGGQLEASERWVSNIQKSSEFNLGSYLKSLFFADKGYYRVIVFIVTAEDLPNWDKPVRAKAAQRWVTQGSPALAKSVENEAVTAAHDVLALVYEFEKNCDDCENRTEDAISQNIPGRLQTKEHLSMTSIWKVD